MDVALQRIELAGEFAAALDQCDYTRATEYLANNCRYERPGQESLVGPRSICDSYRECDGKARRQFESVVYRSEIESGDLGGVRLTFYDELHCADAIHTFRCRQIVYFDENQKIDRIDLEEIPGERERLKDFCAENRIRLD